MAHKNKENLSPYTTRRSLHRDTSKSSHGTAADNKKILQGTHRRPVHIPPRSEIEDRLYDIFRNHGCSHITHSQRGQLAHFCELLLTHQKKQNFTRLLDVRSVGLKHFVDCLIVPQLHPLQFPLLDMGTGPGFPGIPLKILFPEERIILAEGVQKRVEFLKIVRDELQLSNLDIIGRNIDEEFQLPVKSVITRAVEDSRNTLRNTQGCLLPGGEVVQMKGPLVDPEIPMALKEMGHLLNLVHTSDYSLPQSPHRRRLVVFQKKGSTG